jgi:hypothetical protein
MTTDGISYQPSQTFRQRPLSGLTVSDTATIPTRHDQNTLWKDICFDNAKKRMDGEDAILFLTDDNLEE